MIQSRDTRPAPEPAPEPAPGRRCEVPMPFDHEKLDVYGVALDFLVLADGVVERLPRGRSQLGDQLTRASTSIVLNIAEGAGKYSPGDKRLYYG